MVMDGFPELHPYADVTPALARLHGHYRLIVLIEWRAGTCGTPDKDPGEALRSMGSISVNEVGVFKPHPAVYRRAAMDLGLERRPVHDGVVELIRRIGWPCMRDVGGITLTAMDCRSRMLPCGQISSCGTSAELADRLLADR